MKDLLEKLSVEELLEVKGGLNDNDIVAPVNTGNGCDCGSGPVNTGNGCNCGNSNK